MRSIVLLCLCACGGLVPEAPERLTGAYEGTLTFKTACDYLPPFVTLDLAFTAEGQLKSPVLGIDCAVAYEPLAFECHGYSSIQLHAAGWVFHLEGDTDGYGSGTLEGVPTCGPLAFEFYVKRKPQGPAQ